LLTQTSDATDGEGHEPRLGVLKIPDGRLDQVARIQGSRKATPATIEFVLIPGLVKGESREKLDLPALRNVDILVHVVRAFDEPSVPHPEGSVDPKRDIEFLELEIMLADMNLVDKRLERLQTDAKKGKKPDPREMASLEKAKEILTAETPLREELTDDDQRNLRGFSLLTAKPRLLIVNIGERDIGTDWAENLHLNAWRRAPKTGLSHVTARLEAELTELSLEDAKSFRDDLGLEEDTVERLVGAAFDLTDMITFYTAEEKEARAWNIPKRSRASKAAGTVHSDMERGFIRAEVVPIDVLVEEGSWGACREKGRIKLEGKDYPVADGDVIYFRFNV
jgi:GTP-binding protein YchF